MIAGKMKALVGAALVGGVMTLGTVAQAYWGEPWGGGPWSEPGWDAGPGWEPGWGGGPWSEPGWGEGPRSAYGYPYGGHVPAFDRTHQRQSEMHDHKAAMRSVARMLLGRRSFDRAEAIGLAREIEASSGENLVRLFETGEWRQSPLSRAIIGDDDMETFTAHAEALEVAARQLADELEKQPSAEDVATGRAWSPDWHRVRRGWGMGVLYADWRSGDEAVTKGVFDAYTRLRASCHGCHANFRSPWR